MSDILRIIGAFVFIFIIYIITTIDYFGIVKGHIVQEGFELVNTWPEDLIQRFLAYQRTIGENVYSYNIDIVQKQATPEEAEDLLKNGYWYWPDYLKEEYMEKVNRDNLIRIDPKASLEIAMKAYNQTAMKELLALKLITPIVYH